MPPPSGKRYLIDTDVLVHIRHRRDSERIYTELIEWAEQGVVKTVRQVFGELKIHEPVHKRLAPHRTKFIVPTEEQFAPEVQNYLDIIGDDASFLYAVTGGKNPDPADPYLIAVAAVWRYTVVTDESGIAR